MRVCQVPPHEDVKGYSFLHPEVKQLPALQYGRLDLNQRPAAYQTDALPDRATPIWVINSYELINLSSDPPVGTDKLPANSEEEVYHFVFPCVRHFSSI